jgi:hypothetical protein
MHDRLSAGRTKGGLESLGIQQVALRKIGPWVNGTAVPFG